MFEVFPLFPTPVGKIKYKDHDNLKKKVLNFIETNKNLETDGIISPELKHFFNHYNQGSKFFEEIKDDSFKNFLDESSLNFVKYVMGCDVNEMIITDCWLNNCQKNGYQVMHSHANSFISGTYYINYDQEIHPPLKFANPSTYSNLSPFLELNIREFTDFNHKETICNFIEEGTLILWPSHLSHGYEINRNDNRISLSMNFMPSELKSGPYSFKIKE